MIYLCGPRSGIYDTNIPLFASIADTLRASGYDVLNPVDVNVAFLGTAYSPRYVDPPLKSTFPGLRADIFALLSACDSLALLPGWEHAVGCRLEVAIGITFGYDFIDWRTGGPMPRPNTVLIEFGYLDRPKIDLTQHAFL